ncbi:hypothetical protein ACIQ6Y_32370 [Streptomyces sp. NPDC096205]|uniref:hypothetical protein n=1 Tax=Streptomyces sp. NPDC096205 TaxID=3366081 RepID=UPI0038097689
MNASSISRRLLGSAAVATVLAVLGGAAAAAPGPASSAPSFTVGQRFSLSLNAYDTTLMVSLPPPLPKVTFTGRRTVEITRVNGPEATYRVTDFSMSGHYPMFGKVSLTAPDNGDTGTGRLQNVNGQIMDTWSQPLMLTFEQCSGHPGPFILATNHQPAQWAARLDQFPPPPQSTNPDGSPAGGALYSPTRAIGFTPTPRHPLPAAEECPLSSPVPDGTSEDDRAVLRGMNISQGGIPS